MYITCLRVLIVFAIRVLIITLSSRWFFFSVRHRAPVCLRACAFRGPRRAAETAHVELSHTHGAGDAISVHHVARGLAPGQRSAVAAEFHHPFPVSVGQHFRFFGKKK